MQKDLYVRGMGRAGHKFSSMEEFTRTRLATGTMLFGLIVLVTSLAQTHAQHPYADKFTFSAVITTGQSITGKIVINGVESTLGATAFNTSSAQTLTDFATNHTTTYDSADVPVTVTSSGLAITVATTAGNQVYFKDIAVTSGAQTLVWDVTKKITGASKNYSKEMTSSGVYNMRQADGDYVDVIEKGDLWLVCEDEDIDPTVDNVYVRVKSATDKVVGAIKKSADSGAAVLVSNAKFLTTESNGTVPVLFT